MKDNIIFIFYLALPFLLLLIFVCVTTYYKIKDGEPIFNEIGHMFENIWRKNKMENKNGDEPFDLKFLNLFLQAYKDEGLKVQMNKNKYFLYKTLILLMIATVPFLVLFLVVKKGFIMGDNEWNQLYLYIIAVVPIILAFLLNKYINVKQYRDLWVQHTKIKYQLESKMMLFVKDFEMNTMNTSREGSDKFLFDLKTKFIEGICALWTSTAISISEDVLAKEDNIFQDIGSLFNAGGK